jgi:hypothetical protein
VGAFWSAVADIERPLLLAAMLAGFASWRSRTAWVMLAALLILCVTRTLFLTLLTMIEIRYLVPMVPVAELGAVAFWGVPDGPRRSGRSWK